MHRRKQFLHLPTRYIYRLQGTCSFCPSSTLSHPLPKNHGSSLGPWLPLQSIFKRRKYFHTSPSPLNQLHSQEPQKPAMEGTPQNTMDDMPLSRKYTASAEYSKDADKY